MNDLILEQVKLLEQKEKEIEAISVNLALSIEKEIISLVKNKAKELGNDELEAPIFKFKVYFDRCADENYPDIAYRIMVEPKVKFNPEKFIRFERRCFSDTQPQITQEQSDIAFALKRVISVFMQDSKMVEIMVNHLDYNQIVVDLLKP